MLVHLLLLGLASLAAEPSASSSPIVVSAQVTLLEQRQVPAREAGVLERLKVREGALVEAGEELGSIEIEQAEVARERALAELDIAEVKAANDIDKRFAVKSHEVANAELRRSEESVAKFPRSVSQTELERLRLSAQRADLAIEQADRDLEIAALTSKLKGHELKAATIDVERRRILAPISGMVVDVYRRQGEWVDPGVAVLRILRIDKLRVEAFLSANEVDRDLLGRPVRLTTALAGGREQDFTGAITFVSPEVEPVNGQFRVWAEVENPDNLLAPGLLGTLTIEPAQAAAP